MEDYSLILGNFNSEIEKFVKKMSRAAKLKNILDILC